jgi:hypothetical protein
MKFKYLMIFGIISIFTACFWQRQYVHGKTELVGIYDTLINDSCIIEGNIYSIDSLAHFSYMQGDFIIYLKYTPYRTENDTLGHYYFKIPPGTYSVQCIGSNSDIVREEINHIKISPNQKAKINFYIGFIPV